MHRNVKIRSTGKYLPGKQLTAALMSDICGRDVDWIEDKSGIAVRHFVTKETASEMAAFAAEKALAEACLSISDIDCIVCTSGTPQQAIPCTAVLLQKHLGAADSGIPAFDINSTCLSFVTGFDVLSYLIHAGRYNRVLIVSSEICAGVNWSDLETSMLFGEGSAAAILERTSDTENSCILASGMETYSKGAHLSECIGGGNRFRPEDYASRAPEEFLFRMDGKGVYRLALDIMPTFVDKLLDLAGISMDDISMVIPHQASQTAMSLMRKQLSVNEERWMSIIREHGNTIAASIPMTLHEAIKQNLISRGDNIMLLGVAAGLSVGGIVLQF